MSNPLLSLFTPTHDAKHLEEAYDSLLAQDYEHFEWVLLPNGEMRDPIPARVMRDKRVRTVEAPTTDKIGALKLAACRACEGDAFIEFDHDDLLIPGTLTKVAAAIADGAGFVYSDSAVFNDGTLQSWAYHSSHGWESYDLRVYDKPFKATRCFDLTPRALCEVYYAPDHVRVWSREAYFQVGGHNPELSVGDDHELICRTYVAGVPFQYLDCCGYLYRYHEKNTVKKRGGEIQKIQAETRRSFMHGLAAEWSKRNGLEIVEFNKLYKNKKWRKSGDKLPYDDNSVGQLVAWDCLQFLARYHQAAFFNEAYRVLAPSGILHVSVPSTDGRYAYQDPRHQTRFNANSFLYYTEKDFAQVNDAIECRFQQVQIYEGYPNELYQKHKMLMIFADLCALKGQRQPGPQNI